MGTKLKYDVSDVEDFTPYDGEDPKRGVYSALITGADWSENSSGNDMLTVNCRLAGNTGDKKQFDGWFNSIYLTVGDLSEPYMKRNMRQIVTALGLKAKGTFDGEALATKLDNNKAGTKIRVLVKPDNGDDEQYRGQPRINALLPFKKTDAAEEPEEEESVLNQEDLAEMDRNALKALIKENALEIKVTKAKDDDALRAEIAEALELETDEEEPDEEETDEEADELTKADLAALSRAELKALIKERELDIKVIKSKDDDAIRSEIAEALELEDGEQSYEEREAELAELDRADLRRIVKEQEYDIKITKKLTDADLRKAILDAEYEDEGGDEEGEDEPPF